MPKINTSRYVVLLRKSSPTQHAKAANVGLLPFLSNYQTYYDLPIWFSGIDEDTVKQVFSTVKNNCKYTKSFTPLHEMTHLNYATMRDAVDKKYNKRSLDYAYSRENYKKLRDGAQANKGFCLVWEEQCEREIIIEPVEGEMEDLDEEWNDDTDAGPDVEAGNATGSRSLERAEQLVLDPLKTK
ncbi:MAG: hypothetical protein Q9209_007716 [Squamulea sp. 1 TL-2023]